MRVLLLLGYLLLVGLSRTVATAQEVAPPTYAFINGLWFDGAGFAPADFYTVDGFLATEKPAVIDSVIDLTGMFVVSPFGEAHNHNVEGSEVDQTIQRYLDAGIFAVHSRASP